ncbi:MAG TPA: hypothetical protein VF086_10575 [Propionibacteriaceae bacterium]
MMRIRSTMLAPRARHENGDKPVRRQAATAQAQHRYDEWPTVEVHAGHKDYAQDGRNRILALTGSG